MTKADDYEPWRFVNPWNDTPEKLIWSVIGWLAFGDRLDVYEDSLLTLKQLVDYTLEVIENQRKLEKQKKANP